jgi:hypothetical protein
LKVKSTCLLENFRDFLIVNTCKDYIPDDFLADPQVFPEREEPGVMFVEAKDKESLLKVSEIKFVRATEIDRIIYKSKSGNTTLIWTRLKENSGKVIGDASLNSMVNLVTCKVVTP